MQYRSRLKNLADTFLSDKSSWIEKRNSLVSMADLFADMKSFDINEQINQPGAAEIQLNTGYAVSSWSAAMCLMEVKRTLVFLKGIMAAIRDLLSKRKKQPINILDAGCGPFGLLSLIPALYFTADETRFHLIDIIPHNIESVKKLIASLDMQNHFGDILLEDATVFKWNRTEPLDMVVSETMLNALRKEPQVAVTLNLSRQLSDKGVFIPERIVISLVQVDPGIRHKIQMDSGQNILNNLVRKKFEQPIAAIMQLDRHTSYTEPNKIDLISVSVPSSYQPDLHHLELHTMIDVYRGNLLQRNDCSLTAPFTLSRPAKSTVPENAVLNFYYQVSSYPSIITTIGQTNSTWLS